MATQLATLFLRRLEAPVVLTDVDAERTERAVDSIHGELAAWSRGRLPRGKARFLGSIVTAGGGTDAYAGCDLVLEAVFEELAVKRDVFRALEGVVSLECLLVTNTSSLSVDAMASGLEHSGARRRPPLLQSRRRAAARRGRTDACDGRRDARDRLGRRPEARQARRAREGRAGLRRQPDADPAVDRPHAGARERNTFEETDEAALRLGIPMPPSALLAMVGPGLRTTCSSR